MKMKSGFLVLVMVLVLVLVLVSSTTFAVKKQITVVYGTVFSTTDSFGKGDLYFKELVEKKSKGRIKVQYYHSNQLGSAGEMYQAVRTGAQHMVNSAIGEVVPFYSQLGTFDLPYLYRDQKHYLNMADKFTSLVDQEKMSAEIGLRVISVRIRAPRQLTTKFPVNKLEDIKGIKIRIPQQPTSMALWEALGTSPMVVPGNEALTALATGVVVAQENPLETIYNVKIYEHNKYCALTAHKSELVPVVVNNKWWKGLTTAERKILTNAMNKSTKMANNLILESDEMYKKKLEEVGVTFTQPNLNPFREKAKTIWSKFGDQKLIDKIQALK